VQELAAVQQLDYEAIEMSVAPAILPGPTMLKLMQRPQLLYCTLHRHFAAVIKHMQRCAQTSPELKYMQPLNTRLYLSHLRYIGTQEIRFGRKTNEIAKFSILDEKNEIHNFGRNLDENGQLIAEPNAIRD